VLGRTTTFECIIGPYKEKDLDAVKYYPRSVGYSREDRVIKLERFKITKELKKDQYPLYMNEPYIQDFIEYQYSLTDHEQRKESL
jgi:hypothetical protein